MDPTRLQILMKRDGVCHESQMKCDMTLETEIVLKNIRHASDLGPHMKVAWV